MRQKLSNKFLDKFEKRLAGLLSIDANLDLGNGMTTAMFSEKVNVHRAATATHNDFLADLDASSLTLKNSKKELNDYYERILLSVASKFGKDSIEYARAGGVKKSERRRPARSSSSPLKVVNNAVEA